MSTPFLADRSSGKLSKHVKVGLWQFSEYAASKAESERHPSPLALPRQPCTPASKSLWLTSTHKATQRFPWRCRLHNQLRCGSARQPLTVCVAISDRPSPWNPEQLHVLCGSQESARHDGPTYAHRLNRLTTALAHVHDDYDLILIDCPPSLGGLTRQGLTASHRALIVTELGLFSVSAAVRAFHAIEDIRTTSAPDLAPLGVLVNRVRPQSSEQAYRYEELTDMFGPLIMPTYIPERAALQQAQGAGSPIHAWPSRAARDLAQRFDHVLARALQALHSPVPEHLTHHLSQTNDDVTESLTEAFAAALTVSTEPAHTDTSVGSTN